jgi:hypothetical protein
MREIIMKWKFLSEKLLAISVVQEQQPGGVVVPPAGENFSGGVKPRAEVMLI